MPLKKKKKKKKKKKRRSLLAAVHLTLLFSLLQYAHSAPALTLAGLDSKAVKSTASFLH